MSNKQDENGSNSLHESNKAISDFLNEHPDDLSDEERSELGGLLRNRARVLSSLLGIEVHSVADDDE